MASVTRSPLGICSSPQPHQNLKNLRNRKLGSKTTLTSPHNASKSATSTPKKRCIATVTADEYYTYSNLENIDPASRILLSPTKRSKNGLSIGTPAAGSREIVPDPVKSPSNLLVLPTHTLPRPVPVVTSPETGRLADPGLATCPRRKSLATKTPASCRTSTKDILEHSLGRSSASIPRTRKASPNRQLGSPRDGPLDKNQGLTGCASATNLNIRTRLPSPTSEPILNSRSIGHSSDPLSLPSGRRSSPSSTRKKASQLPKKWFFDIHIDDLAQQRQLDFSHDLKLGVSRDPFSPTAARRGNTSPSSSFPSHVSFSGLDHEGPGKENIDPQVSSPDRTFAPAAAVAAADAVASSLTRDRQRHLRSSNAALTSSSQISSQTSSQTSIVRNRRQSAPLPEPSSRNRPRKAAALPVAREVLQRAVSEPDVVAMSAPIASIVATGTTEAIEAIEAVGAVDTVRASGFGTLKRMPLREVLIIPAYKDVKTSCVEDETSWNHLG